MHVNASDNREIFNIIGRRIPHFCQISSRPFPSFCEQPVFQLHMAGCTVVVEEDVGVQLDVRITITPNISD